MAHDGNANLGYGSANANGHRKHTDRDADDDGPAGVTLEQYAAAKRLPVGFLESLNLKDTIYDFGPAVRIPYPDELGREAYHRYRVALKAEPRFKAPPKYAAPNPIPYGLQVLTNARDAGYMWITEGESDTQTLWFIDEPALGVPGVQAWSKFGQGWAQYLHDIPMLLVPVDYDPAGEKFWTLLSSTECLRDRVRRVDVTSAELKDLGALWVDAVENGSEEEFKRAIKGQVYLSSRSRSLSRTGTGTNQDPNPMRSIRAVSFTGRVKPPPREWIVDQAVPRGHATSWYGAGGMAKSFLALHFAISVASPDVHTWAGQKVATLPVVYGDFELDEHEHLIRAQEIVAGMGIEDVPDNFNYLGPAGLPSRDALAISANECERLGAGLFILDSVGYALAGDSELSKDVLRFFRQEIQAIKDTGTTQLLIDHQAKVVKGEKYSDKQEFGSVYKTNSVRSSFQVRGSWEENTMTATFTHKKHNLSRSLDPFSLRLTFGDEKVTVEKLEEAEPDPDKQPTAREKVLAAWEEMGEGTSSAGAKVAGIEVKTVRNQVTDLVASDKLEDTGRKDGKEHIYVFRPGPNPNKGPGRNEKPPLAYSLISDGLGLAGVVKEVSRSTGPVALDTETSSLQVNEAKVRLIQIRTGKDADPVLADCQAVGVRPLLRSLEDKHLLGHNLAYDLAVLSSYYGYEHRGPVSDTMLMFQVFYGGASKRANLKDALKTMLGVELDKSEQTADWFGELSDEMLEYAARDVLYLHDLRDSLQDKIETKAPHLRPVVDLEHRMVKVTAHMSSVGMPVDEKVFAECVRQSRREAEEKLAELDALMDQDLPE